MAFWGKLKNIIIEYNQQIEDEKIAKQKVEQEHKDKVQKVKQEYEDTVFKQTKKLRIIEIDEEKGKFRVLKKFYDNKEYPICDYTKIISYKVLVDEFTLYKKSGGFSSALAGGLLFGTVGAVIGSSSSSVKEKAYYDKIQVSINFYNDIKPLVLKICDTKTKSNSMIGKVYVRELEEITKWLDSIIDHNREAYPSHFQVNASVNTTNILSTADEILKFKSLLDQGIITEEEFNHKKKELLGL